MSLALDNLGNQERVMACAMAALAILEEIKDPHVGIVQRKLVEWRGGSVTIGDTQGERKS